MFERFTAASRHVVVDARGRAAALGHGRVGTEHLLLSLLADEGPAGEVLRSVGLDEVSVTADIEARRRGGPDRDREALASLGIDLDRVREAVETAFGAGALDAPPALPWSRRLRRRLVRPRSLRPGRPRSPGAFSPKAKRALELSLREAVRLRSPRITPAHLALGVLREGSGLAAQVLAARGVAVPALQTALEAAADTSP